MRSLQIWIHNNKPLKRCHAPVRLYGFSLYNMSQVVKGLVVYSIQFSSIQSDGCSMHCMRCKYVVGNINIHCTVYRLTSAKVTKWAGLWLHQYRLTNCQEVEIWFHWIQKRTQVPRQSLQGSFLMLSHYTKPHYVLQIRPERLCKLFKKGTKNKLHSLFKETVIPF